MDSQRLNSVCYRICIACIVLAVILASAIIWAPESSKTLWKLLATVGSVFLGSLGTMSVTRAFDSKPGAGSPSRGNPGSSTDRQAP